MIRKLRTLLEVLITAPLVQHFKDISQAIKLSRKPPIPIQYELNGDATPVSNYWNIHTFAQKIHKTAKESLEYNTWIDKVNMQVLVVFTYCISHKRNYDLKS